MASTYKTGNISLTQFIDSDTPSWLTDYNSDMLKIDSELVNATTPTGTVNMFAGSTAPNGWLVCDGAEVRRAQYSTLFSVIGSTYGAGDGSSTFKLPNLSGRFPMGSDAGAQVGKTGGEASHTLTIAEMPSHDHTYTYTPMMFDTVLGGNIPRTENVYPNSKTGVAGGNAPHNNMPPYLALSYIIKY